MATSALGNSLAKNLTSTAKKALANALSQSYNDIASNYSGGSSGSAARSLGSSIASGVTGSGSGGGGGTSSSSGYGSSGYSNGSGYGLTVSPTQSSGGGTSGVTGGLADSTGLPFTAVGLDALIDDPQALATYMLSQNNGGRLYGNEGQYAMLEPYTQYANNLFTAINGMNVDDATKADTIQWMANYFDNLMTPGGGGLNYEQALSNIINPAEGSPLRTILETGTPAEQVAAARSMIGAVTQSSLNPMIANAIMRRLEQEGNTYIGQAAAGQNGSYLDWVQNNIPRGGTRLIPGL